MPIADPDFIEKLCIKTFALNESYSFFL